MLTMWQTWSRLASRRSCLSALGTSLARRCQWILVLGGTTDKPSRGWIMRRGKTGRRMVYLQR